MIMVIIAIIIMLLTKEVAKAKADNQGKSEN